MTTTIDNGVSAITVDFMDGYETSRATNANVTEILGNASPAVSLHPAGLRRGTLTVGVQDQAIAAQLEALLLSPRVKTLSNTDIADLGMRFVAVDDLNVRLDDSRVVWLLSFGFREVAA